MVDWSQAPDWADWWCVGVSGLGMWMEVKPALGATSWIFDGRIRIAPSFGYADDWRCSLRGRK